MPTRGRPSIIVPDGSGLSGGVIFTRTSLSTTACQRLRTSSFASISMPTACRPGDSHLVADGGEKGIFPSLVRNVELANPASNVRGDGSQRACRRGLRPTIRVAAVKWDRAQRQRTSIPCSAAIFKSSSEYSTARNSLSSRSRAYQDAVSVPIFRRRVGEPPHAVPAMRGRQHLDVVRLRCPQDHLPQVELDAVVDPVLSFID